MPRFLVSFDGAELDAAGRERLRAAGDRLGNGRSPPAASRRPLGTRAGVSPEEAVASASRAREKRAERQPRPAATPLPLDLELLLRWALVRAAGPLGMDRERVVALLQLLVALRRRAFLPALRLVALAREL